MIKTNSLDGPTYLSPSHKETESYEKNTVTNTEQKIDDTAEKRNCDLILKLVVLASSYVGEEYERFKKRYRQYEDELEEWARDEDKLGIGRSPRPKAPEEPKPKYKTVFINFSDLVFKSCFLDVDFSTSEEFVIAEFFDNHAEEVVTFHIKIEHETWMEYMEMYFRYINIQ